MGKEEKKEEITQTAASPEEKAKAEQENLQQCMTEVTQALQSHGYTLEIQQNIVFKKLEIPTV